MPPAARVADATMHGIPLTGAGEPTVSIMSMPAWRVGDNHTCPLVCTAPTPGPPAGTPHTGGAVLKGSFTVLIGSKPAARMGDIVIEPTAIPPPFPPNNTIMAGAAKVQIGDLAFGLMTPDILKQFCEDWKKLLADWPNLKTEEERRAAMEAVVNKALTSAGVPPVKLNNGGVRPGANGNFSKGDNQINMPSSIFQSATAPAGKVGQTLIHEARHAEQYFHTAQALKGMGFSNAAVQTATGMQGGIVSQAAGVSMNSAAGQHGMMNFRQSFGSSSTGQAWNAKTRADIRKAYKDYKDGKISKKDYQQAYKNYFGLPNEADAKATQDALADICAAAR